MITPKLVARINELSRKQRSCGLTDAEKAEQAALRRVYIDSIKAQVKNHLDAVKVQEHPHGCNCGCSEHHKH